MSGTPKQWLAGLTVALLPILAMACTPEDSSGPAAPSLGTPSFAAAVLGPGNGVANFETIEVCKYGSTADVTVAMSQPNGPSSATYSFANGECRVLGTFDGNNPADITASEANVPAGSQFDSLRSTVIFRNPSAPPQVTKSTTNSFSYTGANNNVGILVEFFNSAIPTGGGEGCTPGYWKQSQHFDSWVGYTPNQQFSSVFENAFPGKTLLQVLGQGGGGLKALGRHTVAALLNGVNGSGVDYDLSSSQVIAAFNGVFPGGNYEGQKNTFEGFNQQGCPLN